MSWSLGYGLEDKGVVVTGAAGDIGRSVAAGFASAGARVCAVDLNQAALNDVVSALEEPHRHYSIVADLTDLTGHGPLLQRAADEFGRLDVLAHLAAVIRRAHDVSEITEEDWDVQLDANLKAAFFVCREAAELMKKQGRGGRIINFTSQSWWSGGFGGSTVYSASKGGVVSFTRGLARTYGPEGVLINTVSPGLVDSRMFRSGMTVEQAESLIKEVPLRRAATPEEVAGTVLFLASDHASYITGATLNVSGGFLMY